MRWLVRALSSLAIAAVVATAALWVASQTIANAKYLQRQAADTHLADGIAAGLPAVIATTTGATPAEQAALAQAVTPVFVNDQVNTILSQLIDHYQNGGPAPTFDTTGLIAQATAAGITLPPDLTTQLQASQPVITASQADTTIQSTVQQVNHLQWLIPLAAVVFVALILLLGGHGRWLTLAGTFFGASLGVLVLAGLAQIPPRLIASTLDTSPAKPLTVPIRHYAEAIAHDQTHMLLWIAGGMGVLAVILVIVHFVLRAARRLGLHRPKPSPPTNPTPADH